MTKRKTFGKLLVVSLFIMLFVLLLTISTSAATHDVATEAELTTALTNAADGDTINVTADITLTQAVTLNKKLTIEGNGHAISTSTVDRPFAISNDVTFNNLSLSGTMAKSRMFTVAEGSDVEITISGTGTYAIVDYLFDISGTATVNVSGTSADTPITLTGNHIFVVGSSGKGYLTLGANVSATPNIHVAHYSGNASGSVTLDGAAVNPKGIAANIMGNANFNLTVNSGSLITQQYIIQTAGDATGVITLNGGKIQNTNNQGLVHRSTKKLDFIMTDGEYNNDHSSNKNEELFWYDQTNTEANTIRITGGKVVGGYFHIFGSSNTNIEIGGTAEIQFVDGGEGLSYQGSSKGNVTIGGSAKITNTGNVVTYKDSSKGNVTIGGSAKITNTGNVVTYKDSATGLVTIGGSANLSGNQIALEGSGKIDLTISGTPTLNLTSTYNGINHKSSGGGKLTLSGTWSTNKTIYFTNSKKVVEIVGADTNITVGGSGFYANGCELELTMNEGTVNATNNFVYFLSGATGSATIGGSAKCYFTNGHCINIDNATPTVTIEGSAQIVSKSTANDKEIFYIVNRANATIYVKDNAKLETPNNKWGHAFRVGANTDLDSTNPASATIYIQGSTTEGDAGIDIDAARILDVRSNNAATIEVTGKVDLNSDHGIMAAHGAARLNISILGENVSLTQGSENVFQLNAKEVTFTLEGDHSFTLREVTNAPVHFIGLWGQSSDPDFKHTVNITGNIEINTVAAATGHYCSVFYVEGTGSTPVEINFNARNGNTTDKLVATADRLFNLRADTKVTCNLKTNELNATLAERFAYTVNTAYLNISINAPTQAYTVGTQYNTENLMDAFFMCNGNSGNAVSFALTGNITVTGPYVNFFQTANASDVSLTVDGSLTASYRDNLIYCPNTVTGDIVIDLDCDTLNLTGRRFCDIAGGASLDIDVKATNGDFFTTTTAIYKEDGTVNYEIHWFYAANVTGNLSLLLEGDFTMTNAAGKEKATDLMRFNTIGGTVDVDLIGSFDMTLAGSIAYLLNTTTKATYDIKPRENSATDKFHYNGWRVFNFRDNTDTVVNVSGDDISLTLSSSIIYSTNIKSNVLNITSDKMVVTGCGERAFNYNDSPKNVELNISGNVDISTKVDGHQNIIYIGAGTAKVTITGANGEGDTGFVVKNASRLSNMRENVTGSLTVTGKANVTVSEKAMYHVCCAVDVTLSGDITLATTAADWIISNNCDGTANHKHDTTNVKLLGNTKLIGDKATAGIQASGGRNIHITVGDNAEIRVAGKSVWLNSGASGSLTIQDSANLSGDQVLLEGSGKIDLTISGTPTIVTTSQYNGINHKATGDAKIDLSGVWSTNKTFFCSGGKKDITVSGADTVLALGNSGFYASGADCVLNITVSDATINANCGEGVFTGNNGGTINATVNSGKISNSNKFMVSAHEASVVNLTVNGGELSSNSFFAQYQHTASGSVTYNGGTIKVKDHNLVNFGSGKVNFTMTGGTVTAPNSFVWYENKDTNAATTSTVKVSGGTFTGGYMNIFKTAAVDITIDGNAIVNINWKDRTIHYHDSAKGNVTVGGNAKLTANGGWVFTYENTASGWVTVKDNATVIGNNHGFVNNGTAKADFTIQDNATMTITANTGVYYGGKFPANVVNEINIKGGSLTAVSDCITFPGFGEFKVNISGGTVTTNSNTLYIGTNGTASKFTINISGGTLISNSNDCIEVTNKDSLNVNMTISGGTFHGKHKDLQNGSGYPLQFWGKNNTLTVTGGTFLADYAHAALMIAGGATANVYGGYFEAGALCAARASENGTLNIYGGEFYYNGSTSKGGMPIRSGTGSAVGNVNIYGGNYYTDGTGTIFCCMNSVSNLTLYGGFNAWGGRGLVESANPSSIKSSGHGIGDMWTYASIEMVEGAAVRIVENSNGLRFKGVISAANYAHLVSVADEGSIRFGTLIAPADYVEQLDRFTKSELEAAGLRYLDIPAENGLHAMENGSYEIQAAITNIKDENLNREFAAICYVTYTVDGNEVTTYANYRETKNARSIEQVARLALQDSKRYNANQLAVLEALAPEGEAPVIDLYLIAGQSNAAGSTKFSEAFRDSDAAFTEGYSNIYYSGTAAGGKDFASKNFVEVGLVKAGLGGDNVYGMGAELGMAKALSQYYNTETGRTAAIVKYGYGGTALADSVSGQNYPEGSWCPPSWLEANGKKDEYKSGGLYRAFVKQIESSINDYRAMGYDVNIVAAYWMQGESDRGNPERYAQMFEMWVSDLRADVYALTGNETDKSMPVLVGEISYSYDPGSMHLNPAFIAMQNEMANSIDNLYVINQSPLATSNTRSDTGHWSCDDMLLIGQMVATTALNELVLGEEDEKLAMPYLTGTPVAEVYDAEGNLIETYSSLSWAIGTAPAGATVKLLSDLTLYGPLGINNPNKITIDGQDYMIDIKTDQGDALKLIATDVVLKDFNIKNHSTTEWGMQTYQNAKFVWNGGSFEAESIGIVMNDASIGQLHNVAVTVRNGVEGHSAAIYMGDNSADLWVNGGTVTAAGKAEAIRTLTGYVTVSGEAVITGGTDTAYAISQRSADGYLAIEDGVVVNGVIVNNGFGYEMDEDVVLLPTPEVPETPVETPEETPAA